MKGNADCHIPSDAYRENYDVVFNGGYVLDEEEGITDESAGDEEDGREEYAKKNYNMVGA